MCRTPNFWKLAALTDICVNLRYPSVGETSGIAMKLMAAGKPVLVTEGEEYARFPELAVLRVDAGKARWKCWRTIYTRWPRIAGMREHIGNNAAAYVREHHSLDRVRRRYLELLQRMPR